MQYMVLLFGEEYPEPGPDDPGFEEYMAPWAAFSEAHEAVIVAGSALAPTSTATTIKRVADGQDTIVDGPFAETKEVLGGYYIIDVPDLDAALAVAREIPLPAGSIELRPLPEGFAV